MKNKKITAILLTLVLSFSFSACGSVENSVEKESTIINEETEEEKEESESTEEESEEEETTTKEEETETTTKEEETETTKETETDEVEVAESAEETVKEEPKTEEAKPAATTAPKEEVKPSHTHSYNGTVTVQANCVTNGVKTFTCSCGDSYTENIGYGDHNYVASTQEIYHDEEWSVVSKTIKVPVYKCGCGLEFSSNAEYQSHAVASVEAGDFRCGMTSMYYEKTETVYDNVKISDAWTETITIWTCSVCGKTKN